MKCFAISAPIIGPKRNAKGPAIVTFRAMVLPVPLGAISQLKVIDASGGPAMDTLNARPSKTLEKGDLVPTAAIRSHLLLRPVRDRPVDHGRCNSGIPTTPTFRIRPHAPDLIGGSRRRPRYTVRLHRALLRRHLFPARY